MAVTIVLLLGVIFGMVALAVDAGQIYKVRTQAQNAADAAVLAGAQELNGTATGITNARTAAIDYAASNRVYDGPAVIASGDVVFGRWSPLTRAFTALDETAVTQINAVKAKTTFAVVDNPFMSVFGRNHTDVNATAIATGGGSASDCSFPLISSDCLSGLSFGTCGGCMKMTDDKTDTAGWSSLGSSFQNNPGGSNGISDLIKANCSNLLPGCTGYNGSTASTCSGGCTAPKVDTSIPVYNGNGLNDSNAEYLSNCASGINNACEMVKAMLLRENSTSQKDESKKTLAVTSGGANVIQDGFAALAGKYITVDVPLIAAGSGRASDGSCNPKFASTQKVAGYGKLDIYGVQCKKAGAKTRAVIDQSFVEAHSGSLNSTCTAPSNKFLLGLMRCNEDTPSPGGGGLTGAGASIPRLVQ